jgi:molybdopterin-guanine dinucleotide biosynthesis protein A
MGAMTAAGLLLTGGRSSRMGVDKATLRLDGVALGVRTAGLLARATTPCVEVGPGYTSLTRVSEGSPGRGPLAAVVTGRDALGRLGWHGAVVVVATDLPRLTARILDWLAVQDVTVVPVSAGRPQPLCALYQPAALDVAAALVAEGKRAMRDLLDAIDPFFAPAEVWQEAAGDPLALVDVDTPADWDAAGGTLR